MIVKRIKDLTDEEMDSLLDRESILFEVMPQVSEIIGAVQEEGDKALFRYTEQFDGVELLALQVTEEEMQEAEALVDPELIKHMGRAAQNIQNYHIKQCRKKMTMDRLCKGVQMGQLVIPLGIVGAYVPGGSASYPSTVLMTVIPAKLAGVDKVIVCTPPNPNGKVSPLTLMAAKIAGADAVFKLGGAQAIAAMAFGTSIVPRVEKIVGPGNEYVTSAKMLVRDSVEIDFPAGPSEIMIVADKSANPDFIAWDMLAQLEHGPKSTAILITNTPELGDAVKAELDKHVNADEFNKCAILTVKGLVDAADFVNAYAPEHLQIIAAKPQLMLGKIRNAGTILLGNYAPAAAADYASGANHVLPTSGYARMFSGLSVDHFVKTITVQSIEEEGLRELKDTIVALAMAEGLEKHAESVRKRFEK